MTPSKILAQEVYTALEQFNSDYGKSWSFGTNWSSVNSEFETFVNKFLFPKLSETLLVQQNLGNRFEWLAEEVDFVGQYSEEYVFADSIPVNMNLSKSEELMLKRNYPKIITKLYGTGVIKKQKFTLNNNDVRLNFSTLKDGINYALGVLNKKISDINVDEELEVKAMLVDYALNQTNDKRQVSSRDELFNEVFNAILNVQNNNFKYNEADKASGGEIARYTTQSKLKDIAILTNDRMKTFLLDTKIANTFQVSGLDLSKHIISFDELGGVFKLTADVKITTQATVNYFMAHGDYQIEKGDTLPKGTTLTIDVTGLSEFSDKVEEVKPKNDLFAYIFDVNKLRYKRHTKGMLKEPFYNGEFDEVTYWLHYYSSKFVSPFYNNVLIVGNNEVGE